MTPSILTALVAVNVVTFAAFGLDKARAAAGARRTRESDLLILAALGGTPGALLGRRVFHHKTRKQPFAGRLRLIAAVQAGAVGGWFLCT